MKSQHTTDFFAELFRSWLLMDKAYSQEKRAPAKAKSAKKA